ncbi:MAG: pirin family protein [Christensenellales bacterium]|jgi:redox-sensitive bicupin YhaK (pirin superfamily)
MAKREIVKMIRGKRAVDGAGVRLVRVLGHDDVEDFDPFLMLDSFDSNDPADYLAGFPVHPHRGIETITYLISGRIDHEDSLGNKDSILAGESQWMTAGSGIMHQEMPKEAGRMFGFQLWLNMPAAEKMAEPAYLSITEDMIPVIEREKATVRVLSGSFGGESGVKPRHIPASLYDIDMEKGGSIDIPTTPEETVFVFLLEGDAFINGQEIPEKTAVLFGQGEFISVASSADSPLRFMVFSGEPLGESIAWGGPIVMNTQQELRHAFDELRKGTFIKHG